MVANYGLVSGDIDDYCAAHTTPMVPLLDELVEATRREFPDSWRMLSGPVPGRLLQALIAVSGAKRVLEVGMFTGLSALLMAEALPADGRIVTCDLDPKAIAFAKTYFERSEHRDKIEVRQGKALDTLKSLEPAFDLIFIDADKGNYRNYYEESLRLLAPRGIIAVDNVLWSGSVLDPKDDNARAIVAFNDHVRNDERVICTMLSVRDGMTLIRRRQG